MKKLNNFLIITVCRNWLSEARSLCSPDRANEYKLDSLEKEIGLLEKAISGDYQEIGFCHNDLQYGNIMMDDRETFITIIVCYPPLNKCTILYNFP